MSDATGPAQEPAHAPRDHLALASRWYLEHVFRGAGGMALACIGWPVVFGLALLVGMTDRWPILGSLWVSVLVFLAFAVGVINVKGVWRLTVRRYDAYNASPPMPLQRYARSSMMTCRVLVAGFFLALYWQMANVLLALPAWRGETTTAAMFLSAGPLWLRWLVFVLLVLQLLVAIGLRDRLLEQASVPGRPSKPERALVILAVAALGASAVLLALPELDRPAAWAMSIAAILVGSRIAIPFYRLRLAARSILRRVD